MIYNINQKEEFDKLKYKSIMIGKMISEYFRYMRKVYRINYMSEN